MQLLWNNALTFLDVIVSLDCVAFKAPHIKKLLLQLHSQTLKKVANSEVLWNLFHKLKFIFIPNLWNNIHKLFITFTFKNVFKFSKLLTKTLMNCNDIFDHQSWVMHPSATCLHPCVGLCHELQSTEGNSKLPMQYWILWAQSGKQVQFTFNV